MPKKNKKKPKPDAGRAQEMGSFISSGLIVKIRMPVTGRGVRGEGNKGTAAVHEPIESKEQVFVPTQPFFTSTKTLFYYKNTSYFELSTSKLSIQYILT